MTEEPGLPGLIFESTLDDVPVGDLLTVEAGTKTLDAIQAMNDHGVGYVLVMREGAMVGIFTERDVLKRVVGKLDPAVTSIDEVMTPRPESLPRSALIAFAINRMSVEGYRHIPLVDEAGASSRCRCEITWIPGRVLASAST